MQTPLLEASDSVLLEMYRTMVRIRQFEEHLALLVEADEVRCPCHLYIGQEAIAAGVCAALDRNDFAWGGHRSHGHYLAKGGDLRAMLAEIYGKATGCASGRGGSMHLVAPDVGLFGTVPLVAATIPLAVGAGLASRLRKDQRVSVTFFGDGATEEGHFYESLNLAAVYRLPVVFVCENNLYASHLHISERRVTSELHELGRAHGVPSRAVDGNDVVEVYRAAMKAVADAREGHGPALLVCRTFRWRGHVGAAWDMDVGVKRKEELKNWLERDPIARARTRLIDAGVEATVLDRIGHDAHVEIEAAVEFARRSPYPGEEALLSHVFAERR